MPIYTKNGDQGFTRLADGQDLLKSDVRLDAIGDVDELNSFIGLLICKVPEELTQKLIKIQQSLFVLGAHIATDSKEYLGNMKLISMQDIVSLEEMIDEMDAQLDPMRFFILPGGHETIATAQITRTVCRRAERSLIQWAKPIKNEDYAISIVYLNRLSDYLFMMCRLLHKTLGVPETPWNSGK
jgi:cob(I)alamin adenosyltransferase